MSIQALVDPAAMWWKQTFGENAGFDLNLPFEG